MILALHRATLTWRSRSISRYFRPCLQRSCFECSRAPKSAGQRLSPTFSPIPSAETTTSARSAFPSKFLTIIMSRHSPPIRLGETSKGCYLSLIWIRPILASMQRCNTSQTMSPEWPICQPCNTCTWLLRHGSLQLVRNPTLPPPAPCQASTDSYSISQPTALVRLHRYQMGLGI